MEELPYCWLESRGCGHCSEGGAVAVNKVPDIRQAKGEDGFTCAEACIDAIRGFYNIRKRAPKVADEVHGATPEAVEAALRSIGLGTSYGAVTVDMMQALTKIGVLIMCPIQRKHEGHWVVVTGVGRGRVYHHDPIDGPCSLPVHSWNEFHRDTTGTGRPFERFGIQVFVQ